MEKVSSLIICAFFDATFTGNVPVFVSQRNSNLLGKRFVNPSGVAVSHPHGNERIARPTAFKLLRLTKARKKLRFTDDDNVPRPLNRKEFSGLKGFLHFSRKLTAHHDAGGSVARYGEEQNYSKYD